MKEANSTILDRKLLGNKMAEKTGFEMRVPADCHTWRFVEVEAVDGDGKVLGESDIIPIDCEVGLFHFSAHNPSCWLND